MPAPQPETPTFHPHADLVVADMRAADPASWETALRPVLASGLRWLYETSQPPQAILQHHGCSLPAPAVNRRIDFVPSGWEGRVVLVLKVRNLRYGVGDPKPLLNGLGITERTRFADLVADLGHKVVHMWNGEPGTASASVALAEPAHEALLAAVTRYHGGCGIHHDTFCSRDGCTWYLEGRKMVVEPELAA